MDELTGKKEADARGASLAAPATPADLKRMVGRTDDVPRGIVLMIVATILFAGASAASKWLVGIYPVGETLFIRSLASLITGAAVILPVSGLSVYATQRPRDHIPARHVAVGLATVAAAGLQPDAARRRRRHQFLLAAVCRSGVDRVAQGAGRGRALGRVADRLCRRADRDRSGRQFADARRAVRAGQRHHVRQRHGRGARHDADGIGQYAGDLAADRAGVLSQFFAVFRLALADAVRRGAAVRHRLHQCGRAMVLDQGAAPGAGGGGDAVLLSDAGVVADRSDFWSGATFRR